MRRKITGIGIVFHKERFGGDVSLTILLAIAAASLVICAASYYFSRIKLFSFTLILFYAASVYLDSILFSPCPSIAFVALVTLFVAIPLVCLVIFAVDTHFALFCADTSFALVIVWLLAPVLLVINFISYLVKMLHG